MRNTLWPSLPTCPKNVSEPPNLSITQRKLDLLKECSQRKLNIIFVDYMVCGISSKCHKRGCSPAVLLKIKNKIGWTQSPLLALVLD